jgi:hypothetical protein
VRRFRMHRRTGGNATVNTISFASPIANPLMAVVSLGQPGFLVTYDFDTPFTVLSSGPGFWGSPGTLTNIDPVNHVLQGDEGHGTIQFIATYGSISFTSPMAHWHGFTVGAIPEPSTHVMLLAGLSLLGFWARRRKR